MASVVEDVLQQHGTRLSDINLTSRKADEAASRRYEAAGWLRKMVGVVAAKDLPIEPTEEEFRIGLRNGLVLCNALNKVHPGAILKVVKNPGDSVLLDGAASSTYQYFENIKNFLVAMQDKGHPTFELSDLEQGGKSARVVNCVLDLKSYSEKRQMEGDGSWKYAGNIKPAGSEKYSHSSDSLNKLVPVVLTDRKPEEVPSVLESMLKNVEEEFECRIASQNELMAIEDENFSHPKKVACFSMISMQEGSKHSFTKLYAILEQQHKDIQKLKHTLHDTRAGMQNMQMKYYEDLCILGGHLKSLAHAASGYHSLEENRKLYNEVQDMKGNIRVYCRVRPFLRGQPSSMSIVGHLDDENITIVTPLKNGKEGRRSFTFNKVFGPSASQDEVFSDMQPLIRSVLDGYNVCIFAYGQTGSGKTYTMTGPKDITQESWGVNYRALSDLFNTSEQREGIFCYDISVQMIEIYNEQVRDLLASDDFNKKLEIRNSSQKGLNVPDAKLVPVASTLDVIDLMTVGQQNRAVGATALNDRSSRSHSCLMVHVQGREMTSGTILHGCMHLVDLAGSERVDKSEVKGEGLKEAQYINKSLSALGDVIAALAQKNAHVPYRNSKLTQLLQHSLGGQAKTLMFVHISPELDAIGETISTLKFAERVSTVELGSARLNKESGEVKDLKDQIASLKVALARKGETEHIQSLMSTPVMARKKGGVPLSQQMEDLGTFSNGSGQQPRHQISSAGNGKQHLSSGKGRSGF